MSPDLPTARELAALRATVELGGFDAAAAILVRESTGRPVSPATVRSHVRSAKAKLGARTIAQAFAYAIRRGLIDPHAELVD